MILSTILEPPPEAEDAVERQPGPTISGPLRVRDWRYRRAVAIGISVSVFVHVFLIFLSPLIVRYLEPGLVVFSPLPRPVRDEAMQAVNIRVTEIARVEPEPEPEPEPEQPTPEPEPPRRGEPVGEAPMPTAAERLQPRVGDWRLWVVPPLTHRIDPTLAGRSAAVRERLHALLEEYEDSAAALAALEAERLAWTVGEEGNKWGVSPGKLHLGPLTLPLPFYVGPTREEAARQAEWGAIRRQAGQAAADETFEERVKAIREQREKERKEKEEATEDSTPSR